MTRISFLLPTYNRRDYIVEAIQAVLDQMTDDDELLVIDDGSTDDTGAIVGGLETRVRYVRQQNAGKSAALNLGLGVTDGAFVMICDDDDVLRPDSVAPLLRRLDDTHAGFVFGKYSRFRTSVDGRRIDMGTGYWPDLSSGSIVRHILEDAFVMQNAAIVRRSAYGAVGPFDERMLRSLDYDMFVRLALAVEPAYCDRYIFDQRKHDGPRGPAKAIHAAALSDAVWLEFDRRIFEKVQDRLLLSDYGAMFQSAKHELIQRVALLQRACVNARHGLWDFALADLDAAAIETATSLDDCEIAVCRRILNGKHGVTSAMSDATIARLRTLRRRSSVGYAIVEHMISGAFWRLRAGSDNDAIPFRQLALKLIGPFGLGALLVRSTLQIKNVVERSTVTERDSWPRSANWSVEFAEVA